MKPFSALVLTLALGACSTTGGAGANEPTMVPTTCPFKSDAAFKVVGASNEFSGVNSEYVWISRHRPGYRKQSQALLSSGGKKYDILTIRNGQKTQEICFDITDFFERL